MVESALILAAFMGLLLGMATVGETLFVRQSLLDRVHVAARWGAVNPYNPDAIRNLVLYGSATPGGDAAPLPGLTAGGVVVENPGCPGADCRVSVSVPELGVRSTEPVEVVAAALTSEF